MTKKSAHNAAIYFAEDGCVTDKPKLMGRQVAGKGFLRGFVRHGGGDEYRCVARSKQASEKLAALCRQGGAALLALLVTMGASAASGQLGSGDPERPITKAERLAVIWHVFPIGTFPSEAISHAMRLWGTDSPGYTACTDAIIQQVFRRAGLRFVASSRVGNTATTGTGSNRSDAHLLSIRNTHALQPKSSPDSVRFVSEAEFTERKSGRLLWRGRLLMDGNPQRNQSVFIDLLADLARHRVLEILPEELDRAVSEIESEGPPAKCRPQVRYG